MNIKEYFAEVDRLYGLFRGAELENQISQLCEQCAAEYGNEHPFYAAMLSELGSFYRGQSRLQESEYYFQQTIQILAYTSGTSSAAYATALNNLAGTHRREGKTELARQEYLRCMEIYRLAGEGESLLGASCLNNLSQVFIDTEDYVSAAHMLSQASDILKKIPNSKSEYAASLINLASIRFRVGEYEDAIQELSAAVQLMENELGTDTPHYHAALNLLGILEECSAHTANAAEYYRKALTAAESLYKSDHPEVLAIQKRLDHCLEVLS